jgi:hypothetical protein
MGIEKKTFRFAKTKPVDVLALVIGDEGEKVKVDDGKTVTLIDRAEFDAKYEFYPEPVEAAAEPVAALTIPVNVEIKVEVKDSEAPKDKEPEAEDEAEGEAPAA